MSYNKPEVVQWDSAAKMIQGSGPKGINLFPESSNPQVLDALTVGAYESDE